MLDPVEGRRVHNDRLPARGVGRGKRRIGKVLVVDDEELVRMSTAEMLG